jgi:hypothetical protein
MASIEEQLELQIQLQRAVTACNERCLYYAARWYDHMSIDSRDYF